jgi:hypothetical protein
VSIATIRDGLATNLQTITGLRATADITDNPTPPIAIVQLNRVEYDNAFNKGLTIYNFVISVVVGRASERTAQDRLNAFATPSGASSIKLAVQSDRTLGGSAYDVRVSEMQNIGAVLLGGENYLAADFAVQVYAN